MDILKVIHGYPGLFMVIHGYSGLFMGFVAPVQVADRLSFSLGPNFSEKSY